MPHTRTPLRTAFRHTHNRTLARLATAATATTLIAGAFVTGAAAAAPLEDDRSVTVTTDEYRVDKEVVGSNEKVPGSTVTYRTSFSPTDAPEYFNWVSDEYAPGLTFVTGTLYLSDTNGTKTALDTSPYVSPEGDTPHVSFRPGDIWVGPGWALVAFHVPPELQYFTDSAAVTRFTQPYVEEHWKLTPVFDAAANTVTFADPGFYIPATEHGHLSVSVSFFIPPDSYEIGSSVDSGLTVDIDGLGKQTWNPIGLQFHIRSYEAEPCFLCVDYGGGDWDNGFWGFGSADLGRGDNETLNLVSMMLGS
ncbi:hypothetical protein ACWDUM_16495 [Rhodococcus sp. NPDC003322]